MSRQFADGSPAHKYFLVHAQSNRYAMLRSCLHHLLRYANDASDCSVRSYHPVFCSRYLDLHQCLPAIHPLLPGRYLVILHQNHGWFQHFAAADDPQRCVGSSQQNRHCQSRQFQPPVWPLSLAQHSDWYYLQQIFPDPAAQMQTVH